MVGFRQIDLAFDIRGCSIFHYRHHVIDVLSNTAKLTRTRLGQKKLTLHPPLSPRPNASKVG